MADIINFRKARKAAQRIEEEKRADANRIAFGRSKGERKLDAARAEQARRHLDAHRIEQGDAE